MPNDQYGYPMPPETPEVRYAESPPNAKGFAIASMVIGIVSVCLSSTLVLDIFFIVGSIIGLVLAVSSKKRYQMAGLKPHGMATAGLVLNIIGLVFNGIGFLACIACLPFILMA
jgi:hypothetical protein